MATLTIAEHLEQARDRISKTRCWIQGYMAVQLTPILNVIVVEPTSEQANCWCAYGALLAVGCPGPVQDRAIALLARNIESHWEPIANNHEEIITEYNDAHSHAQVLERFAETIKIARESK